MKKSRYLAMALSFIFMLTVLLLNIDTDIVSAATTPSFEQTKIELVGEGSTYQLAIKNKIDKSTYSWSSSNTSIAKVNKSGLVTAKGKGSAKITCKVTYPSGKTTKTKTLACTVTVTIPATSVKINNANLINGAHILTVGDSYDFNCDLKPEKTSDKAYWFLAGGDTGCLRIDDAANGKVTALKAGKAMLAVAAGKSATKEVADASLIRDTIIVEVVEAAKPTLAVTSVNVVNSGRIDVEFDNPVVPDTVIAAGGELSSNIEISMGKEAKKGIADDPGKLKASLSSDGKLLTISTEKSLNGSYIISFSGQIRSVAGASLTESFKKITYKDTVAPFILRTTVDDTGLVATINFSEPVNFTNMTINDVAVVPTTGDPASTSTLSILSNPMNYMPSEDKTSLTIDLTNIAYTDRNKSFKVVISGITDMAGNLPEPKAYLEAYVKTDTTNNKPQARLLSLVRTGYNTITATFDRAIDPLCPGYLQLDNGSSIQGKVDSRDNKKVNFTISDADASITGSRKVKIGFWNSYNVDPYDSSASKYYDKTINFIDDKTAPLLMTYEYDPESSLLTLTYNEGVTITSTAGTIPSTYTASNEDIRLINIGYTELAHNDGSNIIKLRVTNLTLAGDYSITIPQGFVTDSFRNYSLPKEIKITTVGSSNSQSGTELRPPYYVAQNTDDLNKITIRFMDKLDTASAQTLGNYRIPGVNITSVALLENTVETGATVVLTLAQDAVEYNNLNYKLIISGIKGYNNSYSAISNYECQLSLKENKKPSYKNSVFDKTTPSVIKLNFSEAVKGTMSVKAIQYYGGSPYEILVSSVEISGTTVTINLSSPPLNNSTVYVNIVSYDIKDLNGNSVARMPDQIRVEINY